MTRHELDVGGAWTTQDLAAHYQVPLQTVQVAAKRGLIPGTALVLGRYLFDPEEALKWVPGEVKLRRGEAVPTNESGSVTGFKKGNAAAVGNRGTGRPSRRKEEKFLLLLSASVSEQDWKEVILKAIDQAKEGDRHARKWLSDYLIGTPVQRVLVDAEVSTSRDFEAEARAAAIEAMLETVVKGRVIDGAATVLEGNGREADSDGKGST